MTFDANGQRNDESLLRAAIAGDFTACAALIERHGLLVQAYCLGMLGDERDAADAAADVFSRAMRADPPADVTPVPGYLLSLAHQDHLGRIAARRRFEPERAHPAASPLMALARDLDPTELSLLEMHLAIGADQEVLARALDRPAGDIDRLLTRLRQRHGATLLGHRGAGCDLLDSLHTSGSPREVVAGHARDCFACTTQIAMLWRPGSLAPIHPASDQPDSITAELHSEATALAPMQLPSSAARSRRMLAPGAVALVSILLIALVVAVIDPGRGETSLSSSSTSDTSTSTTSSLPGVEVAGTAVTAPDVGAGKQVVEPTTLLPAQPESVSPAPPPDQALPAPIADNPGPAPGPTPATNPPPPPTVDVQPPATTTATTPTTSPTTTTTSTSTSTTIPPTLNIDITSLELGPHQDDGVVSLGNPGAEPIAWSATTAGPWSADRSSGVLGAGSSDHLVARVDRSLVPEGVSATGTLVITSAAGTFSVDLMAQVDRPPSIRVLEIPDELRVRVTRGCPGRKGDIIVEVTDESTVASVEVSWPGGRTTLGPIGSDMWSGRIGDLDAVGAGEVVISATDARGNQATERRTILGRAC